jgi:hypothetical protein
MMSGAATRFAGKALGDFFKTGSSMLSNAAEQGTLGYLKNIMPAAADAVDAKGMLGGAARLVAGLNPEVTSKLVGAATPFAAMGTAALALSALTQPNPSQVYASSAYSLPVQPGIGVNRQPVFPNQQYAGGGQPMTNLQAGEAMLEQQRFQHQLELIRARQTVSNTAGSSLGHGGGADISGVINLAKGIYG